MVHTLWCIRQLPWWTSVGPKLPGTPGKTAFVHHKELHTTSNLPVSIEHGRLMQLALPPQQVLVRMMFFEQSSACLREIHRFRTKLFDGVYDCRVRNIQRNVMPRRMIHDDAFESGMS